MNLRHFREILQYVPAYRDSTFVISVDGEIASDANLLNLVEEVVADALVQEERESFALERVAAGESTVGLFPLSEERMPDFEAWRAEQKQQE